MSSRLDRLFVLLENGSSSFTRKAAAKQLGEVQRLHPHELHSLLARIKIYLQSSNWDTRIAAGQAVQAVVENVPKWIPKSIENDPEVASSSSNQGRLKFEEFDINSVLKSGTYLMGSEGFEYDFEEEGGDTKERIIKQRKLINMKLGLDKLNLDITNCMGLSSEDLTPNYCQPGNTVPVIKKSIKEVVQNEINQVGGGLSSREKNRARRKMRQMFSKQRSVDPEFEPDEPKRKKSKVETEESSTSDGPVPDLTGSWGDASDWPFESFCEQLVTDLFSPRWETRHGAATALREVITCQGRGAGKVANSSRKQMEADHRLWLEDISLRLLCVLLLDRFGDFVSDQVVAPVRETCAQVLGAVVNIMNEESVKGVLRIVLQLLNQKEWEARHGGLLALKYTLAVREDLVSEILPIVLPSVLERLSDEVDDVSSVAASSLIPVAEHIVTQMPDKVGEIVDRLWDLLLDQDELAAACNSFMGLLAALINIPKTQQFLRPKPICELITRLWPFLSHNATSVRKATLQTLYTLTSLNSNIAQNECGYKLLWSVEVLQEALRYIFQRVLIESNHDVQNLAEKVWFNLVTNTDLSLLLLATCPYISTWLCLTMQHPKLAFDNSMFISPTAHTRKTGRTNVDLVEPVCEHKYYIGGSETTNLKHREHNSVRARTKTAKMLGLLSCYIIKLPEDVKYDGTSDSPVDCYTKVLLSHLNTKSALQRQVVSLVISEWARIEPKTSWPQALTEKLHHCLNEKIYFDEIGSAFTRLLHDTKDYLATLKHYKIQLDNNVGLVHGVLTLDEIMKIANNEIKNLKLKKNVLDNLEDRRKNIKSNITSIVGDQASLSISTQAALAGAVTSLQSLPDKLNPVVKPLMESVKKEENEILQSISAEHLSDLVCICVERTPCPNPKIIANLCAFLCSDPQFTPRIQRPSDGSSNVSCNAQDNFSGILTLINQQTEAEKSVLKRQGSVSGRGPGRPPSSIPSLPSVTDESTDEEENQRANRIQRRGATFAVQAITRKCGDELPTKLPKLWSMLTVDIKTLIKKLEMSETEIEELISCLQVFEMTCSVVHPKLLNQVLECKEVVCEAATHKYRAVRHVAARCIASLSLVSTDEMMLCVVETILPQLGVIEEDCKREGAVEVISCILEKLQFNIVPYVVLLVVPLLGRMSDQNQSVRLMATQSFASLVQLMPLDGAGHNSATVSSLAKHKEKERLFLQQLLHPKTIPDYKIPVPIKAELRSYQQAGVNWLGFLNKYKLHGILCDDMGLGKTLQSMCMLASDHYYRQQKYNATRSPDCYPLPSIVICPPTLTGHWCYEVEKFLSNDYLNPLQYVGPPVERERLRSKIHDYNLVVVSYDIVRKDIDFFRTIKWNYCILDEGHIIKNGKTKASKAIKTLIANHRLILSGTPIQNNVLELWSLFDFLMPGFLSSEKQFSIKYSRPILTSRDPKSSPKEQEAGVLAMEALHRQVLPFLLRRMKEDVLNDLPPKITQDYICELSPLQEQLYEDFSKSQAHQDLEESIAGRNTSHIFQALRYLQNVCNHPKLVLTNQHPEFARVTAMLQEKTSSLNDIQHACKLPALKQLLLDLGIGTSQTVSEVVEINQHRALIFCQLKSMLDIIQNDLLSKHLPNVSYLRLDGSVPPSQRHGVVSKFNTDPSIEILLLTTQVGGLGLNLTGADTVIFVEHDWNPMKDVQAMDRAHRIGQKKVVNVYRLITKGTLEEKIMGLQKFKLLTANTVITDENASSMDKVTGEQIFDLFSLESGKSKPGGTSSTSTSSKGILDNLPDLWEEQQYDEEYDLSAFVQGLKK